jgi:hypothetical protein
MGFRGREEIGRGVMRLVFDGGAGEVRRVSRMVSMFCLFTMKS